MRNQPTARRAHTGGTPLLRTVVLRALLPLLLLAAAAPALAAGRTVGGIHIRTDRSIDFFSRETILAGIIEPGMTNEEKAIACYELVRTHIYHFPRPDESDPKRVLNVYGYALCGTIQRTLVWLAQGVFGPDGAQGAGMRSRPIENPETFRIAAGGWLNDSMYRLDGARPPARMGHTWCQLYYDGRYHYLDAHAGFFVYTADGKHIASIAEISGDPTLVTDPVRTSDPFMPCDRGRPEFFYRATGGNRGPGVQETQHSMALRVRPGETLIFHFDKLPGRHFKRSRSWRNQWAPDYYEEGPHLRSQGPEVKSYRHYGNGEIIFEPDLTRQGFRESLVQSENLADDGLPGLRPKAPGQPAYALFAFETPYVMVAGSADATFAAAGAGQAAPRVTFIPPDRRARPQTIEAGADGVASGTLNMDDARYPFSGQVRIDLPAGSSLTRLRIHFVTQLNFHTLPRPLPGQNTVFFNSTEGDTAHARLQIEWAWTEAGGREGHDTRPAAGNEFEYQLTLGEVDTTPADNPKYMRWLKLSIPDDR